MVGSQSHLYHVCTDDSVMKAFCTNPPEIVIGSTFTLVISAFWVKGCLLPLNIMDQCNHFMADIFTQCDTVRKTTLAHLLLACFTVSLAIVSSVRELCLELLCCGSNTSRHRERSVPDMWRRGAGKRWHWRVMKKCLCVRGLKNRPFRVVCPLAKQRQRPVSEICCKDYLVHIMYQGMANRIFFLCPLLALLHLLRKDSSFLCIPLLSPRSSPGSMFLYQYSLSKPFRIIVPCTCTNKTASLNI